MCMCIFVSLLLVIPMFCTVIQNKPIKHQFGSLYVQLDQTKGCYTVSDWWSNNMSRKQLLCLHACSNMFYATLLFLIIDVKQESGIYSLIFHFLSTAHHKLLRIPPLFAVHVAMHTMINQLPPWAAAGSYWPEYDQSISSGSFLRPRTSGSAVTTTERDGETFWVSETNNRQMHRVVEWSVCCEMSGKASFRTQWLPQMDGNGFHSVWGKTIDFVAYQRSLHAELKTDYWRKIFLKPWEMTQFFYVY